VHPNNEPLLKTSWEALVESQVDVPPEFDEIFQANIQELLA
jgi:hypothetical protein